ncbi:MAG: tetratricopeptide repeat protein, partial [Alphaproteobacteria bacterium]
MSPAAGPAAVRVPRILHQTWRTAALPERLARMRATWLHHHPGWSHRLWTDDELRAFVAAVAPDLLPVFDGYGEAICRVDMARYLILERIGGVYADLDTECLRPIDPLVDGHHLVIGREPARHDDLSLAPERGIKGILCPSLIASVPGHPFWRDVRRALVARRSEPDVLEATGPFLLTRVAAAYRGAMPVTVVAPETIYPLDKEAAWDGALFDLERWEAIHRSAFAIHHWDGSWFRHRHVPPVDPVEPQAVAVHVSNGDGLVRLEDDVGPARRLALGPDRLARRRPALVSCLMVTRGRAPLAQVAIECFRRQTWPERELVIVDDDPDDTLTRHVDGLGDPAVRIERLPDDGRPLGELRNRALAAARGSYICQWDDDDLPDPLRIEVQMEVLFRTRARACFLRRWVHWWPQSERLALSSRRIWEGSMLAEKAIVPAYPAVRRGEDTAPMIALCRAHRVAHVDAPRLIVYGAHGRNTHHANHYENLWTWATAKWQGPRYRALRAELARRLPLDAYEAAARTLAAAPAPDRRDNPPAAVAAAGDPRIEARRNARRRPAEAIRAWQAVLATHPDDPEATAGIGRALLQLRRFSEAEAVFRTMVAAHPGRPDGALGLARTAARRDDAAAALQWCATAARGAPDDPDALAEQGEILRL